MEGEAFEHTTDGFDLGKPKEPKVEVEEQAIDQTALAQPKPKGAGRLLEETN